MELLVFLGVLVGSVILRRLHGGFRFYCGRHGGTFHSWYCYPSEYPVCADQPFTHDEEG